MKYLTAVVLAMFIGLPALAEDANPPAEPPKDPPPAEPPPADPPPDEPIKPPSEEELRLRLVESQAKEKADLLKKRMEAAKTDTERSSAINEVCGGGTAAIQHPLIVQAVLPYLNPRPIRAGLQYGDGTINAAVGVLKSQPFDETYYGVKKMIGNNRTDLLYVTKLIAIYGEIKCVKAVDDLVEMMRDKRDGRGALCKAATEILGKIGHRDAISQLIAELEEQDKAGPNDVKMKARRADLNAPVLTALKNITGQEFKLGSQYRQWWIKNAETFQKEKKKAPPSDEGTEGK